MAELKVTITGQDKLTPTIEEAKRSLNDFSNTGAKSLGQITERFNAIKTSAAPLKRQLRELKAMMADMQMGGQVNTAQYTQIAQYAGKIQDAMSDASKAVTRFSDDTMGLKAAADTMQLAAAGATAVTGAMGLLGVKSDEVKNAILKVQSAMAILNAVQTISNKLNKDSALVQYAKALRMRMTAAAATQSAAATSADTAANVANAASAKAATAANTALAVSMNALPWVAAATLAVAAGVAIYKYVSAQKDASKADEEARRQRQDTIKFYDDVAKSAAQSAAKQVTALMQLSEAWKRLANDNQRNEWIRNNQKAFSDLGLSIKSVADAENVFNKNTPNVIKAMLNRAAAAAATSVMEDKMRQALDEYNKVEKHRIFRRNDPIDNATGLIEGVDYTPRYNNGVRMPGGFLTDSGASKMTERDRQRAKNQIQQNHADAMDSIRGLSSQVQKFIGALSREFGVLTESVPQYTGNTSATASTSGGTSKSTPAATVAKQTEEAVKGSWAWFEKQIKAEKELADATADATEREMHLRNARALGTERDVKFNGLYSGQSEWDDYRKRLDEQIKKVNIKEGISIPLTFDEAELEKMKKLEKLEKLKKDFEKATEVTGDLGNAFNSMGDALDKLGGEGSGSIAKLFGTVFDGAAKIIPQIERMIVAHEADALASGMNSASKVAWPANIAAIASIVATIMGVIATISSLKFASGGVVPGTSFSGDQVHAMLNSGEMVLNTRQQRNLFRMIDGGGNYGGGVAEVQLKVRGSDLYGALTNYNTIKSKTRR